MLAFRDGGNGSITNKGPVRVVEKIPLACIGNDRMGIIFEDTIVGLPSSRVRRPFNLEIERGTLVAFVRTLERTFMSDNPLEGASL